MNRTRSVWADWFSIQSHWAVIENMELLSGTCEVILTNVRFRLIALRISWLFAASLAFAFVHVAIGYWFIVECHNWFTFNCLGYCSAATIQWVCSLHALPSDQHSWKTSKWSTCSNPAWLLLPFAAADPYSFSQINACIRMHCILLISINYR